MKKRIVMKPIISFVNRGNMLIALLLFLIPVSTLAQGRRGPGNIEERVKNLKKQLSLTDEQSAKVKEIMESVQKKMQEEREKNQGNRQAMREAMMKIRSETDDKIMETLTPEQKKEYEKIIKERNERRRGGGNRRNQ